MPAPKGRRRSVPVALIAVVAAGLILIGYAFGCAFGGRSSVSDARALQPSAIDVGFSQDMAAHHAQALEMAGAALTDTTTPAVVALARQILLSQSKEIGMLQGWLALWHAAMIPSGPPMTWMPPSMPGMAMSAGAMPGMASRAELNALEASRGHAFDDLFLKLMIRHHLGGVQMADYAAVHAGIPEVRSLAGLMSYDQQQEIALMRALLKR